MAPDLSIDFDTGGGETFGSVRLSADGQLPASHYGADGVVDAQMDLDYRGNIPPDVGVVYFAEDPEGWTWETALADMGLQVIQEEVL